MSERRRAARTYRVSLAGVPGAALSLAGRTEGGAAELTVQADPDSVGTHRILVRAPAGAVTQPS